MLLIDYIENNYRNCQVKYKYPVALNYEDVDLVSIDFEKINEFLDKNSLNYCAIAYRSNLKGESNINFSKRAFDFIKKQEKLLQKINIIHKPKPQPQNGFFIPGFNRKQFAISDPETVETVDIPDEDINNIPTPSVNWQQAFQ